MTGIEQPPMDGHPRARAGHRLAGAAALLTVLATVAAVVLVADRDNTATTLAGGAQAPARVASEWQVLPPSPLSPRRGAATIAIGHEVLVLGGTNNRCPPGADCVSPKPDELLVDAAAYDVKKRSWRRLSDVPDSLIIPVGTIGDKVFATSKAGLFAYDVSDDRWTALPAAPDQQYRNVTVAGDVLLSSVSQGNGPDLLLNPSGGGWTSLPASPLGAGSGRRFHWTGTSAVLFDHKLVAQPGAGANPWFSRYAVLDLTTRAWGPVRVIRDALPNAITWDGERLLSVGSFPRTINGGGPPPGDYGREYPTSGYLDLETAKWSPLPEGRPRPEAVGVGPFASSMRYKSGGNSYFDAQEGTWLTVPPPPSEVGDSASSAWVGERLFVWGGSRPTPPGRCCAPRTLMATGAIWTP